jgi:hypothetical protein
MAADYKRIQQRIQAFDFNGLFTQELMWNHLQTRQLDIPVDGVTYALSPIAERGMAVYICIPPSDAEFPKYPARRKIDVQVSKTAREHIIIFHDQAKTVQIWQWVKKEAGKASACREQIYYAGQSADAITQKVQGIQFSLEDEPSVLETRARVGAAFDVEKVTKKFYEQFKQEHDAFLKFIKGIPDEHLQRWYVSVMLNRLMFIYFIQKKGFLAGDQNYLASRLAESKRRGKDLFYRKFLCLLFFEGFAKREEQRSLEMNRLLGRIPYLNGGLFLKHQIEELHGEKIEVPDRAFERIVEFFEQYDWHLDDRPTRTGREINPDVLGYVFEKYINQKEMGAYYTKEDITGYISQNTIIPALFDMARKSCRIAFEGEHSIWRLLQQDPDRYIYPAMLHGMDKELPANIAQGIKDVSKRTAWNRAAGGSLGLPTETWREAFARRERSTELRKKLAAGEIGSINDLITYNLDIRRFAEEVISNAEGPELLRAFYKAIENISVLDPACGSGAFLFAALNILERLYDACLSRMQAFVDDLDRSNAKQGPEKYSDFRKILAEMNDKARHPSPRYFILKSIILNNLYGVDIMEEATEICKLRLFLKLVAQVNAGETIEPLPDIDFNIRAGNTLVGFATEPELNRVLGSRFDFDNTCADIKERAQLAEIAYERFREMQVAVDMNSDEIRAAKSNVQERLAALRSELDGYLSGDYGIPAGNKAELSRWQYSHKPFHWFVEFYGIMQRGGFHAVVGNPPYVERRVIEDEYDIRHFVTESTNNLFAYVSERAGILLNARSYFGFIIPVSSISTDKFVPLQRILRSQQSLWLSHYDDRPSRLFDGIEHARLTIVVYERAASPAATATVFSSKYNKWYAEERGRLFGTLAYTHVHRFPWQSSIPKIGHAVEANLIEKLFDSPRTLEFYERKDSQHVIYYTRKISAFLNVMDFVPEIRDGRGRLREPSELKTVAFATAAETSTALCLLNSTLCRWLIVCLGDCRNLNRRDVVGLPFELDRLLAAKRASLTDLARKLSTSLASTSEMRSMRFKDEVLRVQCIIPRSAKQIIDEIDHELADFLQLGPELLDFIINYEYKYRMGTDAEEEGQAASVS